VTGSRPGSGACKGISTARPARGGSTRHRGNGRHGWRDRHRGNGRHGWRDRHWRFDGNQLFRRVVRRDDLQPGPNLLYQSDLASFMCTGPGSCQGDFAVTCDGPEDCGGAGHQCCLTSGAAIETSCVNGQCLAGRATCHRDADCAEGEGCCTATSLGYAHGSCQVGVCPPP
jgi:hypothetical protein